VWGPGWNIDRKNISGKRENVGEGEGDTKGASFSSLRSCGIMYQTSKELSSVIERGEAPEESRKSRSKRGFMCKASGWRWIHG